MHGSLWEEREGSKHGWGGVSKTGNLYENRDCVPQCLAGGRSTVSIG